MLTHATDLLKGSWRYATGLRGFLAETTGLGEAERILSEQLHHREETFLLLLERGIYGNSKSPYRRLLQHAGFDLDDVRSLIRDRGLEGALKHLHDKGVFLTLDEFKERAPIRRAGLEFPVRPEDLDNPLLRAAYEGRSGGSRGGGTRVPIDFDFIAYEAAESPTP